MVQKKLQYVGNSYDFIQIVWSLSHLLPDNLELYPDLKIRSHNVKNKVSEIELLVYCWSNTLE